MTDIGAAIQLSLAPVFLLVAIGSFLNVITNRLGRVIDRAREMENLVLHDTDAVEKEAHQIQLAHLDRRMSCNHWSINFFSIAALIVTVLVGVIFLIDFQEFDAPGVIAALFGAAMVAIILGICFFLAEIYVATSTVRVQSELIRDMKKRRRRRD